MDLAPVPAAVRVVGEVELPVVVVVVADRVAQADDARADGDGAADARGGGADGPREVLALGQRERASGEAGDGGAQRQVERDRARRAAVQGDPRGHVDAHAGHARPRRPEAVGAEPHVGTAGRGRPVERARRGHRVDAAVGQIEEHDRGGRVARELGPERRRHGEVLRRVDHADEPPLGAVARPRVGPVVGGRRGAQPRGAERHGRGQGEDGERRPDASCDHTDDGIAAGRRAARDRWAARPARPRAAGRRCAPATRGRRRPPDRTDPRPRGGTRRGRPPTRAPARTRATWS